ncbi:MAG: hypothetical protein MJ180_05475 [Candidatus Gastranaerophilales bacterium]|nr:hypothetical protein [Candidatus Gastranaerophilales bacterium]
MALTKRNTLAKPATDRKYRSKRKTLSGSISKNWTRQAIACYKSNHNCAECTINSGNYSFVCQMPKVIKCLLKELGEPELTVKAQKLA